MLDILAVVGSSKWPVGSERPVKDYICGYLGGGPLPDLIISGGAAGVDSWAIEVARELGVPYDFRNYLPENPRWQPRGFKARNLKIARTCTRLLAVRSVTSRTFGSGWTAIMAEELGKSVHVELL